MLAQRERQIAPEPQDCAVEDVSFQALDGRILRGHLFLPVGRQAEPTNKSVVCIGPAAAVPSRFYRHFAGHVARRGHEVLTFDVREIGINREVHPRQSQVRMRDWALQDVAGAIAFLEQRYPGCPIHWVGHSMGGFATALARNGHKVSRQLCVATLNGYWGRVAGLERWRVLALMGAFAPMVLAVRGYMPGMLMGGEDMPAPAFREWRRWCLHPDFVFGDATLPERVHVKDFHAPVRFLQFSDDPWGTPASVGAMADKFTASRDAHVVAVTPEATGGRAIGHFGFFRPEFEAALWRPHLDWLLAD